MTSLKTLFHPAQSQVQQMVANVTHASGIEALQSPHGYEQAAILQKREEILRKIADKLEASKDEIMAENAEDVKKAEQGKIDDNLMQRLGLKPQKFTNLLAGIRSIAKQDEPIRKVGYSPSLPLL